MDHLAEQTLEEHRIDVDEVFEEALFFAREVRRDTGAGDRIDVAEVRCLETADERRDSHAKSQRAGELIVTLPERREMNPDWRQRYPRERGEDVAGEPVNSSRVQTSAGSLNCYSILLLDVLRVTT